MKLELASPIQQTEQINGFYLLNVNLDSEVELQNLIGKRFDFANSDAEVSLFMLKSSKQLQMLSSSKIVNLESMTEIVVKNSVVDSFQFPEESKPCVVLASEIYIANAFAIAKTRSHLKQSTVVMLSGSSFPFQLKPARFWSPEMPDEAIGASMLLEDWGIVNRIASSEMLPGCFHGELNELFFEWAEAVKATSGRTEPWQVIILAEQNTQHKCIEICKSNPSLTL